MFIVAEYIQKFLFYMITVLNFYFYVFYFILFYCLLFKIVVFSMLMVLAREMNWGQSLRAIANII